MEEAQETLITIQVPPGYREYERLDVYVTSHIANATRAKVQAGILEGRMDVNGRPAKRVSQKVQPGDTITCRVRRPPPLVAQPEAIPLDIVYEDDDLIVVNKPAGMVVHPAYGHRSGTLVNALLHHVGAGALSLDADEDEALDEEDVGLSTMNALPPDAEQPVFRPGIVHRIDKDTSGLLVVARHDAAHAFLARQFMEHTIHRRYQALVWGHPDPPAGTVDAALGRDPRDRKKMAVVRADRGKRAVTHFETVETHAHTSLLAFRLETGRTHQIRVHARYLGHPIVGDATYGGAEVVAGPRTNSRAAFWRNLFTQMPRQALHAYALGFVHPRTREDVRFEAPLPADMAFVLQRLRDVEPG